MPRPNRQYDLSKPEDAARYVAAMSQNAKRQKRYRKRCVVCGTAFEGNARRIYCGPNCNASAYYRRNHPHVQHTWRSPAAAGEG